MLYLRVHVGACACLFGAGLLCHFVVYGLYFVCMCCGVGFEGSEGCMTIFIWFMVVEFASVLLTSGCFLCLVFDIVDIELCYYVFEWEDK